MLDCLKLLALSNTRFQYIDTKKCDIVLCYHWNIRCPSGGSTTAQSVCHDESPEVCAQMDISICTSIAYSQWAQKNCMKTCNMCAGGSGLAMTTAARRF